MKPGWAGEKGRRNTALALAAGPLYAFSKDKDTIGAGLAGGALYAWKRYDDAKDARQKRQRQAYSSSGSSYYRSGSSYSSYRPSYSSQRSYVSSRPSASVRRAVSSSRPAASSGSSGYHLAAVTTAQKAELAQLKTEQAAQQQRQVEFKTQIARLQSQTETMAQQQSQALATMEDLMVQNRELQQTIRQQQKREATERGWMLGGLGVLGLVGLGVGLNQLRRRFRFHIETIPARGV
jgi:hypothetical protein